METRSKILGFINLVLGLFFLFVIFWFAKGVAEWGLGPDKGEAIKSFIFWVGVPALPAYLNLFYSSKLLFLKATEEKIFLESFFVIQVCFWLLSLPITYFFASTPWMPFFFIIVQIFLVLLAGKVLSEKQIGLLFVVSFFMIYIVLKFAFEEDYCVRKGKAADPTGRKTIIATKEDAEGINSLTGTVKAGDVVYVYFATHMLCHRDFQFWPALRDAWRF